MKKFNVKSIPFILSVLCGACGSATLADQTGMDVVSDIMGNYAVIPNITYVTVGDWEGKLDIYVPRGLESPNKTMVYYHGGGMVTGTKEVRSLLLLPYMLNGWTIVNVEYRLAGRAKAPAGTKDAWCALQWVYKNADESFQTSFQPIKYHFDTSRIVTTGTSAGAYLALLVAMAPDSAGLDTNCPSGPESENQPPVAAVADWFGATDLTEFAGPDGIPTAGGWIEHGPDATEIAQRVSPVTYVRKDIPPIISVHGDADTTIPYAQKVRFHEELEAAGSTHEFITIKGGGHGIFAREDQLNAYAAMEEFLEKHLNEY